MTAARSKGTAAARLFRAMLRLYPSAFRDEYGREMTLVFADRYRDEPGRLARLWLWLHACAGILVEAPREHGRHALADLRLGWRRLRRAPVFTLTAVGTLALAIAVTTTLFSVLDARVLRPLAFEAPDTLVLAWTSSRGQRTEGRSAYALADEWKRRATAFTALAVFDPASATYVRNGVATRIGAMRVAPEFLPLLGVQPFMGRTFSVEEAGSGVPVALISYRFWERDLGGSRQALGSTIDVDGHRSQVIGILPPAFAFPRVDADVWEPPALSPDWDGHRLAQATGPWLVLGRLRPGATLARAQQELQAVTRDLDARLPADARGRDILLTPLDRYATGATLRATLWMLMGAGFCVLVMAAANIAGLSAGRGAGRAGEMAIRTALGATRSILVRQLAAEGVLVACLAGALGLLGAGAAVRIVPASPLGQALHVPRLALDHRALAWTFGISCLTAVLVALVPALTAGVRPWASAAAGSGRTVAGTAGARRLRQVLVVAQFAIAIVLLVAAGLLIRSWLRLEQVDPGFEPDHVLSLQLSTPASWSPARRLLFYDSVLERVRALPAVIAAGTIGDLFVADGTEVTMAADTGAASAPHIVKLRRDEVSPGLFDAIGAPIVQGRAFSSADGPGGPLVAVINRALADRLWPGQSPVGRQFKLGADPSRLDWFTVVGVIGDMHRDGLEDVPPAQMFEPLAQNPSRLETLLVHTSREDPLEVTSSVEHAVHAVDAQVPVYDAATLDARLGSFLDPRRVQTALVIGFAGVALLMTWLGLYGLVQYAVATRRREIAIRMAVGARAGQILGMIVREGLRLSLVGLGIGLLGALAIGQAEASLLFEVSPYDPMTFSVVASLLTLLAVAASYVPARRAARIQAVTALRAE